jgi:hypothetical protein
MMPLGSVVLMIVVLGVVALALSVDAVVFTRWLWRRSS